MNLYYDFDNLITMIDHLFLQKFFLNISIRKMFFSILIREIEDKITINEFMKVDIIYENIFRD